MDANQEPATTPARIRVPAFAIGIVAATILMSLLLLPEWSRLSPFTIVVGLFYVGVIGIGAFYGDRYLAWLLRTFYGYDVVERKQGG